ncbi:hypothetical protein ALC57_15408, partial [Trachymyrmex cornetzi]
MVSFFKSALLTVFDRLAPISCGRSSRPPAPWINAAVRKLNALKSRALNRFRSTRSNVDWTRYKDILNATAATVRREKKAFISLPLSSNSPRHFWRSISLLGAISSASPSIPNHLLNSSLL